MLGGGKSAVLIDVIDKAVKPMVWASIMLYVFELLIGSHDSFESPKAFLWAERLIAVVLTFEVGLRAWMSKDDVKGYFFSPLGVIDVMSVVPFWVGFFVPVSYLGLVRTLRIIRFGKFIRYSRHLQLVLLGFYRAWPNLRSLLSVFVIIGLFNTVLIHELEKSAQPDSFGSLGNCAWYVLVSATTVGYGDMSPATGLGKLCAATLMLIPALIIYASIVGVVGAEFVKVVDEERDPSIDPLEEMQKQKRDNERKKTLLSDQSK